MFVPCRRGLVAACVLASAGALAVVSVPGAAAPEPVLRLTASGALPAAHGAGAFGSPAREAPARKAPARQASRGFSRPAPGTLTTGDAVGARQLLEPGQATPNPSRTLLQAAADLRRRREEAAADLQRRREQAAAAAAQAKKRAAEAAAAKAAQQRLAHLHRWVRPNYGGLSSPFGMRWGRMHEGIDLAGGYGSPILAATAGRVSYAGPESGYGRIVKILDWDGTQTWYGHMSKFLVKAGEEVVPGQPIALVGAAGDATGPHLHFEVHVGGAAIDPIPFLAARGVRI